jgi:hypothetical protein
MADCTIIKDESFLADPVASKLWYYINPKHIIDATSYKTVENLASIVPLALF